MNTKEFAKQLAKEMVWKFDESKLLFDDAAYFSLQHPSGDGRSLNFYREKDKWRVVPQYPNSKRYGGTFEPDEGKYVKKINVSRSKTPAKAAEDINRRVLSDYYQNYADQKKRHDNHIAHFEKQDGLLQQVADFLDEEIPEYKRESSEMNFYGHGVDRIRFSGDTMMITTDYLPKEIGMEVLKLLKEKFPKKS